jgi:hypothetical protein
VTPSVRVHILRSTGDFGNVSAEAEADWFEGSTGQVLTQLYREVSDWIGLAVQAEKLIQEVRTLRAVLASYAAQSSESEASGEPETEEYRQYRQRQKERAVANLAAKEAELAGIFEKMEGRKP